MVAEHARRPLGPGATTISTWSGAETSRPAGLWRPEDPEQVGAVLALARDEGSRVRVIGAGHSFTPLAMTEGHLMNLDRLSGIVGHDAATGRVRFHAGTRLRDVPALLAPLGLALPNQGDVDPQSLAGALSTGTHGTGLGFTGFGGITTGLTLLTADGRTLRLSADEDPEAFDLARVGLGVLGVVLEVEFQCVPAFDLIAQETGEPLEQVLEDFPERAAAHDHVEFFWFPHTDVAAVKTNTRVAPGAEGPGELARVLRRGAVGRLLSEELVDNLVFAAISRLGHTAPGLIPALNRVAGRAVTQRAYRAPAHEVFVSPRRVRFQEMEYALPLEAGPEALRELRRLIERRDWRIGFPVEARVSAADDVPLSTAYARPSMYLAVHRYHRDEWRETFREMERVLLDHGGRPHWGKRHSLGREQLAGLYPRFEDFRALRARLDPEGLFANAHTDHLLGPVTDRS